MKIFIKGKKLLLTTDCSGMLLLSGCNETPQTQKKEESNSITTQSLNSLDSLKHQFSKFQEFVKGEKKEEVKNYFNFPIKSFDLWYKIKGNENINTPGEDSILTETDFENYYNKLFTGQFVNHLSKIIVPKLFNAGKFITDPVTEKENSQFVISSMEALYLENEIRLILSSKIQNELREEEAEHTEIYTFKTVDYRIIFDAFYMAG